MASEGPATTPDGLVPDASPNPVSTGGTVRVTLPETGRVRVVVDDVLGQAVGAGRLAPGVYVVRVEADETSFVRRVTVVR